MLALAAEWLGMGGPAGLDTHTTARGFVRNFVVAMDEPDDGFQLPAVGRRFEDLLGRRGLVVCRGLGAALAYGNAR